MAEPVATPREATKASTPEQLEGIVTIGPVLATGLRAVGIPDPAALREAGVDEAMRRPEAAGKHDCSHARPAIEAALAGVRWHGRRAKTPDARSAT